MSESQDTLALGLWRKYSVPSPHEDAAKYRNPCSEIMVDYASRSGEELKRLLAAPDALVVIGGSLGYGAAIRDSYDIDLRLLFPQTADAKERLAVASAKLHEVAGFDAGKIVGVDKNIYHHYKRVKIEGLPEDADAYLTLNLQLQKGYAGMADLAKLLPAVVIDRLVVAKGLSAQEGEEAYEALKIHWKSFLKFLSRSNFREISLASREVVLAQAATLYPLFLREGESK